MHSFLAMFHNNNTRLTGFFRDKLAKLVPEGQTILYFTEAEMLGVAVASAGPYASHLHLVPHR